MDTRKNAQYHQHSGKCIKTVMRNHLTFVGKIIITKTISKCWERCREKETLVHSWRACKLGQPQRKIVWRFLKNVKTEQLSIQFSSVQSFSRVRLFVTPWTEALQASLSITNSQSLLKLMSIELVMPSNHLLLCSPLLLLPPIPPSIRVFSNESTLRMR